MKEKKYFLYFKDSVPNIGSTHLGDKGIHSQFSNFIDVGMHYDRVLGALNSSEALNGTSPFLNLLTKMTRTVYHNNNTYRETFNLGTQALFVSHGSYTDPNPVKSKMMSWEMGVLQLESKVMNTSQLEMKTFKRNKISVIPEFIKAMDTVISTYTTKIYPSLFYKAVFEVPDTGKEFNESFGLLRNVTVDSVLLNNADETAQAGSKNSTVRNHYRAISKPTTVAGSLGVTPDDIDDVKKYLLNYTDNESKEIVAITSSKIINTLAKFYSYNPTKDYFLENGIPSVKINGVHFIEADNVIPEDFIFFAVYDPVVEKGHLLTKVLNPHAEYQGLYIDVENANFAWESVNEFNLAEVKLVVGDIGVHLTGRFRGLWLDCGNRPNTDGLMTSGGIDILKRKYAQRLSLLNGMVS